MPKQPDPTLRQSAEAKARAQYLAALAGYSSVPIELVAGHEPHPDVRHYWCVCVEPGLYRACIVYHWPGRKQTLFTGTDGAREDVVRWLSNNGVPAVRLGKVTRSTIA